jgi:hypothetical protein
MHSLGMQAAQACKYKYMEPKFACELTHISIVCTLFLVILPLDDFNVGFNQHVQQSR